MFYPATEFQSSVFGDKSCLFFSPDWGVLAAIEHFSFEGGLLDWEGNLWREREREIEWILLS